MSHRSYMRAWKINSTIEQNLDKTYPDVRPDALGIIIIIALGILSVFCTVSIEFPLSILSHGDYKNCGPIVMNRFYGC